MKLLDLRDVWRQQLVHGGLLRLRPVVSSSSLPSLLLPPSPLSSPFLLSLCGPGDRRLTPVGQRECMAGPGLVQYHPANALASGGSLTNGRGGDPSHRSFLDHRPC